MPWLNTLKEEGVFAESFSISEGFCERMEIFSNTKPLTMGFVTAMTISDSDDYIYPYKWLHPRLGSFLSLFEFSNWSTKLVRRFLWSICSFYSSNSIYPQRIPLEILNRVAITEDSYDFEEMGSTKTDSLIYKLRLNGFEIVWNLFTALTESKSLNDDERLMDLSRFKRETKLFIPIYISVPDKIGHKFGPHSTEIKKELLKLDKKLEVIVKDLLSTNEDSGITIIGDHGMDEINLDIDVGSVLEKIENTYGYKRFEDFNYFLDSTILRIWCNRNKRELISLIKKNESLKRNGYFFESDAAEGNASQLDKIADLTWWAKKGVVISPDFFHSSKNPLKGMHGYLERDHPSSGFFIRLKKDLEKYKIKSINSSTIHEYF